MASIARKILLKVLSLTNRQKIKSKMAPKIEELPIIMPIAVLEKPLSTISRGVIYEMMLSKTVKKKTMRLKRYKD
jgi:hypothetical protein